MMSIQGTTGPIGPAGPEGPRGPKASPISRRIKAAFIALTVLFFLILCGFAWVVTDIRYLTEENDDRITEIQDGRLESCQRTYEGIREVFSPFFEPEEERSQERQDNIDKFNDKVDELKANCPEQIKAKEEKNSDY